ncbi:MAG: spore maturation protein [Chitinivibrionales bacterium]|nr:spore maturation protein [Chitinivibrionales bacterium]
MDKKPAPVNIVWLMLVLIAVVTAAYTGKMEATVTAFMESAKSAVNLAIGLIGFMAFWLGLTKVAEQGGLTRAIARGIRPLMVRLFPQVPEDHPAMSAMIMNFAANALGMGNAATPLGIKAMVELDSLNKEKGTATNAMCLFLAINTSNIALFPGGVIAIRSAAGASNPSAIIPSSFLATLCSTITAICMAKYFEWRAQRDETVIKPGPGQPQEPDEQSAGTDNSKKELVPPGIIGKTIIYAAIAAFAGAIVYRMITVESQAAFLKELYSFWLLPMLMGFFLIYGYLKGVRVYEAATEGAKDGFQTAVRIIPFLVAILVAIGMFRASGAFDFLVAVLNPLTSRIGLPAEALPVALMRPLSGSGSFGIMSDIVSQNPDSFVSTLVSTMQGSTETTFYVLAVYFGAVGIKNTRHALPAALTADTVGVLASVGICRLMF